MPTWLLVMVRSRRKCAARTGRRVPCVTPFWSQSPALGDTEANTNSDPVTPQASSRPALGLNKAEDLSRRSDIRIRLSTGRVVQFQHRAGLTEFERAKRRRRRMESPSFRCKVEPMEVQNDGTSRP